jgi:uncharacterized Tic20 family protein
MTESQPPVGSSSSNVTYQGPPPDQDAKTMGMLAHLLAIVLPFLGPLIIWLLKKDSSPFVDDQGKESLNFQITMFIVAFACALTICIGIGVVLLPLVGIANLVLCIIAGVQANKGIAYRYPFAIRLIK